MLATPRIISMIATDSSMLRPNRTGITRLNRMMSAPTTKMVNVWPTPQNAPINAARKVVR
jgi:hypothetical protein